MDLFSDRPTLLRTPTWYSNSQFEERTLPLRPGDYKVSPPTDKGGHWTVTTLKGETVYQGIGPVAVILG